MTKRYYYHLTQKRWAHEITLKPRLRGENRAELEPRCKRICVSPSIEGCLVALGCCLSPTKNIYIYRTAKKVIGKNPTGVLDSKLTKEKWLTRPIRFVRVGIISRNHSDLQNIYNLATGHLSTIKKQKSIYKNLFSLKKRYID